jgi:hypothetical protein
MLWAKMQSKARFNLATSGVAAFRLRELPVRIDQFEINGDSTYGYAPLQQAIARKCAVDPECVVAAAGTSMANHLAISALINPGDEVLLENPTYELITSAALYLGANVKHFERREENGFALDPAEIRAVLTPRTKLIILTNLHNPSSVLTPDSVLREVGELAKSVGAHVLVDEVYLDAVYENTPRTSFHLGPQFIVTNSLTKVYGLSGLRCGWILAQPAIAREMWRLNDLFGSIPAHPAELLSVIAFENLDKIRECARRVVEADRLLLANFLNSQEKISAVRTNFGTTAIVHLLKGHAEPLLARLRAEFDTSAVPGRFFGLPNHFRIGMGVDTQMFSEGLQRMAKALQDV